MFVQILKKGTKHDFERKGCTDCKHCVAYVNWWCINKEATEYNGTAFPEFFNCKFWEPCRKEEDISWLEKLVDAINGDDLRNIIVYGKGK